VLEGVGVEADVEPEVVEAGVDDAVLEGVVVEAGTSTEPPLTTGVEVEAGALVLEGVEVEVAGEVAGVEATVPGAACALPLLIM